MRQETINIYTFDELGDKAKEVAREWYRKFESAEFDIDEDDIKEVARILGITIKERKPFKRAGLCVYWTIDSACDGASFEGIYSPNISAPGEIRKYAPEDTALHDIADELHSAARVCAVGATITCRASFYDHSGNMCIEMCDDVSPGISASVDRGLRAFADWIYTTTRREYEYRLSAENVDANILANGYEFYESGKFVL